MYALHDVASAFVLHALRASSSAPAEHTSHAAFSHSYSAKRRAPQLESVRLPSVRAMHPATLALTDPLDHRTMAPAVLRESLVMRH